MKKPLIILGIVVLVVAGGLLISKTGQHQNMNPTNNTAQTEPLAGSNLNTTNTARTESLTELDKAPDFHLQNYNGKTVSFADFSGKAIVINSWASWCPFCRQELPDFVTAQKELGDKVVIIAINRAESLAVAKGYSDQQGITGKLIFLLDFSDSFYQSIGGFSMPETIFVDRDGNITERKRGPMEINEIRQKIQKLISQ